LHKRSKPDSDYDVIVLLESSSEFFEGAVLLSNVERRLEASVYHTTYFLDLIKQHSIAAVIVPHYPPAFVIYESYNLLERVELAGHTSVSGRLTQRINKYALRQSLESELNFKLNKAKHCWNKLDEKYTAVKIMSHVIRYILHGTELAITGTIASFEDGNQWWDEIVGKFHATAIKDQNWERDYEVPYRPVVEKYWQAFIAVTDGNYAATLSAERLLVSKFQEQQLNLNSKMLILDFIEKHGIDALYKVILLIQSPPPTLLLAFLFTRTLELLADITNSENTTT